MQRIHLDHNASTALSEAARRAWLAAQEHWANPSSLHREGQQARCALDAARAQIAAAFGCRAHELILCSGGTEALFTALRGLLCSGVVTRLLLGAAEHSAVRAGALALQDAMEGTTVETIAVDGCLRLDREALVGQLASSPAAALVCLQYANNESGCCNELLALVAAVREAGPQHRILLDACHGAGKRAIDLAALDIDCAAFAGHKFGAPKGCGGLLLRGGLQIEALIPGGGQQQGRRSGTEDLAAAAAMAAALDDSLQAHDDGAALEAACQAAWAIIADALPEARWLGREVPRLPGCMLLLHPAVQAAALLPRLDLAGFAVSRGAACASMAAEPSPALIAAGIDAALAASAIRVSAGPGQGERELTAFAGAYVREVQAMLAPG